MVIKFSSVQFSRSVLSDSLRSHGLLHARPPWVTCWQNCQFFHNKNKKLFVLWLGRKGFTISLINAAAAAKSLQLCLTLCDPIDGSPLGSSVPRFSRQEYWSRLPFPSPMHESEKWKWSCSSRARLLATPWTAAYQAPRSMGFSRQEYRSGVPLPSPKFLCYFQMYNIVIWYFYRLYSIESYWEYWLYLLCCTPESLSAQKPLDFSVSMNLFLFICSFF